MNRLVILASGALALFGCSSNSEPPGDQCKTYSVPSGTDLTTPAVSFKNDVVPIFVLSCAFTTCHGAASGQNQGVYLGSKTGDPGAAKIYAATVGVASSELAAMPYVSAGDPSKSYLMHKIDGDVCTLNAQCTGQTCGDTMPQGNALLDVATRDTIRRWIAQGAKND